MKYQLLNRHGLAINIIIDESAILDFRVMMRWSHWEFERHTQVIEEAKEK